MYSLSGMASTSASVSSSSGLVFQWFASLGSFLTVECAVVGMSRSRIGGRFGRMGRVPLHRWSLHTGEPRVVAQSVAVDCTA